MGKWARFIFWVVAIIIGRLFDAYTTLLYTPDLKKEGNPIVHIFGGGWNAIIVVQIVVVALVVYGLYFYTFKFKTVLPAETGLTFKQYVSFFCFRDKDSFHQIWYRRIVYKPGLMAVFGYVTTGTLIFASYLVGISTAFLILIPAYKPYYRMGVPFLLLATAVIAMLYFSYRFFKVEYDKYRLVSETVIQYSQRVN